VALGLTIEGASLRSAEIDIAYDSPAFGIPGPVVTGTGRITVTLSGAPGAALGGRLVLRANPAGIESGTVSVLSVRAVAQDGSPVTGIDLPAPVTLRIAQ